MLSHAKKRVARPKRSCAVWSVIRKLSGNGLVASCVEGRWQRDTCDLPDERSGRVAGVLLESVLGPPEAAVRSVVRRVLP
jgi:hypothetical protein